jgi:predicted negative regulator of RcsB-dependent stress response
LALSPDSSETFFKEVEENLRRDQLQDFFKSYGKWLAAAVVLFLAAVGGWIYWDQRQQEQSAAQSEELHAIFSDIADQRTNTVPQRLDQLDEASNDLVKASAILAEAAVAL